MRQKELANQVTSIGQDILRTSTSEVITNTSSPDYRSIESHHLHLSSILVPVSSKDRWRMNSSALGSLASRSGRLRAKFQARPRIQALPLRLARFYVRDALKSERVYLLSVQNASLIIKTPSSLRFYQAAVFLSHRLSPSYSDAFLYKTAVCDLASWTSCAEVILVATQYVVHHVCNSVCAYRVGVACFHCTG